MLFNSYPFVFGFLPAVILGYAALTTCGPHRNAAAFLAAASLFFYGWWNWRYLLLIVFSIAFNFSWAQLFRVVQNPSRRKQVLAVAIAVNLGLLGYFKYRNFLIASLGSAAGVGWSVTTLVLPLAISFFSFEQIIYQVAAYNHEADHDDFLSYCLYITLFPHLIAGPIVRYGDIIPQFKDPATWRLRSENLSAGLMVFAIGLFKKAIIADAFRPLAGWVYDGNFAPSFADAWLGTLAFTLQIYFDFSGYSDMAIGLAQMFNLRFPENFESPYKSRDIIDFWRRWHMTLSFFLRDYLYIPLGGNRRGELRRYFNLFVTMLLGGLWHGANWTFVVWGALHGGYLSINHLWRGAGMKMPQPAAWMLTFALTVIAWVFFRAQTFARAWQVLSAMAGGDGFGWGITAHSIRPRDAQWILIVLGIVLLAPNRQQIMRWQWRSDWAWAFAFAALAGVSVMRLGNPPPFIYFQF